MDKLISICMCTRNRSHIMLSAIKCILSQTYKNFEFIIVDDCSTDNTESIIKQLQKQDNRIKYIKLHTHNFISARNTAFNEANGEYIALIDSDDMCSPNKIEEQYKYLEKNKDIDVVGCKIKFGKKTSKLTIPNSFNNWDHDFFEQSIKNNENISMLVHFPSIMFRKSLLDNIFKYSTYFYNELSNGGEDQIFLYTLYLHGAKFANINTATYLYNYLEYSDAISSTVGKHFNDNNFIFKYIHNKKYEDKIKIIDELYNKYNKVFKTAIITVSKNDHQYIEEWYNWHIKLGFTDIFIADNNLEENKYEFNNIKHLHIIPYHNQYEHGMSAQNQIDAINYLLYNYIINKYDYCICLDIDEFIDLKNNYNSINNIIYNELYSKNLDVLYMPWLYYTDNGYLYENELQSNKVTENYTTPLTNYNELCGRIYGTHEYKTLFKVKSDSKFDTYRCVHNPVGYNKQGIFTSKTVLESKFYIRHYRTKCLETFIKNKLLNQSFSNTTWAWKTTNYMYALYSFINGDSLELKQKYNELLIKHNLQQYIVNDNINYNTVYNEMLTLL